MAKYRKKPGVIEARQFHASDYDTLELKRHWGWTKADRYYSHVGVYRRFLRKGFWILTLKGWFKISFGDWIITRSNVEYYFCKPDTFEATYEAVTEADKSSPEG